MSRRLQQSTLNYLCSFVYSIFYWTVAGLENLPHKFFIISHYKLVISQLYHKQIQLFLMNFPAEYPYVVGVSLAMAWQMWTFSLSISKFRRETFNEDFMQKEWGKTHQNQLAQPIQRGGYPDMGSGVYSQKLSYRDWYRFNVLQRIHLNYVEGISLAQTSLLAAGIYRPKEAAIIGLIYIIGRMFYSNGYKSKKGALSKRRIFGVVLATLAVLVNSGIFVYNLVKKN